MAKFWGKPCLKKHNGKCIANIVILFSLRHCLYFFIISLFILQLYSNKKLKKIIQSFQNS